MTKLETVTSLLHELNATEISWLSGYLACLQNRHVPLSVPTDHTVTILYGSHGGNGKSIAAALAQALRENGAAAVKLVSTADYKTPRLARERLLFIVISTHGEGEPPDTAKAFYDFLHSTRAPQLPDLKYAVLALGDSSYAHFCQTGREVDERFAALGATAILARVECDVDYEQAAAAWRKEAVKLAKQETPTGDGAALSGFPLPTGDVIVVPAAVSSRAHPFTATILESILLTDPPRYTTHLELSLAGSDIAYQPGDSLGIWPENPPEDVAKTAAALNLNTNDKVTIADETATVAEWLTTRLDITRPTTAVLIRYQSVVNNSRLQALTEDKEALRCYLDGRCFAEIFADFPPPPACVPAVFACLRRLAPRLYSLASSAAARGDEAHLLVKVSEYTAATGAVRRGVCSDYLTRRRTGDTVRVYLQENDAFRLPADSAAPVIMIGAGSGVAPFRGFLEEREANGGGDSWLFFGNRHRRSEFYYQAEWQSYLNSGVLTRLDVAFSRDGSDKRYVQDALQQHGQTVWQWLQDGAFLYICGGERMAQVVDDTLATIAAEHGGGDGGEYCRQLRDEGRYQRDVY